MQQMNLREATNLILREIGYPETVDNFNRIYRPLLKEINEDRIPSEKKGKGNFVKREDIEEYIKKLQTEEQNKILIYDKDVNDYVVNKKFIVGQQQAKNIR